MVHAQPHTCRAVSLDVLWVAGDGCDRHGGRLARPVTPVPTALLQTLELHVVDPQVGWLHVLRSTLHARRSALLVGCHVTAPASTS